MIARRVRLTPEARDDLLRLVAFLERKSERAARRAGAAIVEGLRSLSQFAERGRLSAHPEGRELVIRFGRAAYIVQYRVADEEVVVARIFHSLERR